MKKRDIGIGGIILVILVVASAFLGVDLLDELGISDELDLPPISEPPVVEAPLEWYEIYFTNPSCPAEEARSGGLDEIVADDMRQAQLQVDVVGFDIDSEPIVQALIDLEEQGVRVRVVTDEDNGDLPSIRRLRGNGISVAEDKRTALMHNKWVVIDGRFVWVGSLNLTGNGVYCNNNNFVRFDLPNLAANYLAETDEMYDDRLFGPDSPQNTPTEELIVGQVRIENYFGPEREIAPIIARTIARGQEEILFMAFSFTDEQVGESMLGRADAGVQVRGVFETVGSNTDFSYFPVMNAANLPNLAVRTDGNSRIMHHKVIIVDRETVIFGSFNFSNNANRRNDENIVIIHDPTFASFFVEEFETVWNEAG